MSQIQKAIQDLYDNSSDNINKVMLGYKYINNQETNIISIVYEVDKKKSLSELSESEIIPKSLNIDGVTYQTDVIEDPAKVEFVTCYTNFNGDPEILRLQSTPALLTPLRGGQEIIEFPTGWTPDGTGRFFVALGTLGCMAVDNEDNRVIGLTNAHVLCNVLLENSNRTGTQLTDPYNLFENRTFVNGLQYPPGALCRNGTSPNVQISNYLKRYSPYSANSTNFIDACILGFNSAVAGLITDQSYRIHRPTNVTQAEPHYQFATTAEIDGLLTTPNVLLYSTGRTTGPKGYGNTPACQLVVNGLAVSAGVSYNNVSYPFADLIRYRYADNSNFPVAGGDSGSVLLARINNVIKIVGLVFAGNSGTFTSPNPGLHTGFACRIDRVAAAMNIRAWDSSYVLNNTAPTSSVRTALYANGNVNNRSVVINGRTFWNVGLTRNSGFENL